MKNILDDKYEWFMNCYSMRIDDDEYTLLSEYRTPKFIIQDFFVFVISSI